MGESLQAVASVLGPLAERKAIGLEMSLSEVGTVWADPRRLRQILYNLISNAIRFTPEGGRATVGVEGDERELRMAVEDNGIGVASEDLERIFEVFEQVQSARPGEHGSGLGLAITRHLVRVHGDRIEVESTPGRGSRFTVVLPRRASVPDSLGPDGKAPGAASSLLLVEDNAASALRLRHFLTQAGDPLRWMADGEKSLQALSTWTPAAIILDFDLPGMDGWEVLRRLKEDPRTRTIPVIVTAGRDERDLGLALGAVDYLVRPLNAAALLEGLGRHTCTTGVVRVLAVDDAAAALDLCGAALEPAGFQVLRAGGGVEGLQKARQERPDVILRDLIMPDLDGFQVVSRLRSDPRTVDIPVLVVTAHQLTEADKKRFNGDIMGVMAKGDDGLQGLQRWLKCVVPTPAGQELLDRECFDPIVSDCEMPRMSGLDTLAAARQKCPGIPCLVVSGGLNPERRDWLAEQGIPWLGKPYRTAALLTAARDALS